MLAVVPELLYHTDDEKCLQFAVVVVVVVPEPLCHTAVEKHHIEWYRIDPAAHNHTVDYNRTVAGNNRMAPAAVERYYTHMLVAANSHTEAAANSCTVAWHHRVADTVDSTVVVGQDQRIGSAGVDSSCHLT